MDKLLGIVSVVVQRTRVVVADDWQMGQLGLVAAFGFLKIAFPGGLRDINRNSPSMELTKSDTMSCARRRG